MPTPNQYTFSEKVALITDGTYPIGRAVAMQLALYGSYVIVGYPQISKENKRALEEMKSLGTLANAFEANISKPNDVKKLINEVESLYGRLDLLVNCPKFESECGFENISEEEFDRIIDASLKAIFFITQEALRLMKSRPKPKVVNVLSNCDSKKNQRNHAFASANSALIGFTRSLAETLPEKFRVNAVAVSEIKERTSEGLDPELFRLKNGLDEDDVARTILYLLSPEAIGLNGQILEVG